MFKTYRHFIREGHTSDEVLPFKDYPLVKKFQLFNKLFFDSAIPNNMPVVWGKTGKAVSGTTTGKFKLAPGERKPSGSLAAYTKMNGEVYDLKITMSTAVPVRPEWKWDGILLHEMVHAYLITQGYWFENHGSRFLTKVHSVSKEFGRPVPVSDTISPEEMQHVTGKPCVLVTYIDTNRSDMQYSVLMPTWKAKANELKATLRHLWIKYDMEITAFFVPVSKLATRITLSRTLPATRYGVSDKTKDMLLTDRKSAVQLWTMNTTDERAVDQKAKDDFFNPNKPAPTIGGRDFGKWNSKVIGS